MPLKVCKVSFSMKTVHGTYSLANLELILRKFNLNLII